MIAIALISGVVTLMLYGFVHRDRYLVCRPALFIGGVVFMPLFVPIAVVLQADWNDGQRAAGVVVLMIGFWMSAAWLTSPRTQGRWVSGLTFGPELEFRPDLVLPGGVTLVKGVVLTGIGMMLAFQDTFRLPMWSWWGFVLAFSGIMLIIPIRGMTKMLARRARFLGRSARWQVPVRWLLLAGGLFILVYGFLAAFMGRTPFTELRPVAAKAWLSVVLLTLASGSLLLREIWKRRVPEGLESRATRSWSNLWLYLSVVAFMYGYIVAFMGRIMRPHPAGNLSGLMLGGFLFGLGASLVLVARPLALHNELRGMVRVMVGALSAMESERRGRLMMDRMRTIASCPVEQRARHIGWMSEALDELDPPTSQVVEQARAEVMMSLPGQERRLIMEGMDRLVA